MTRTITRGRRTPLNATPWHEFRKQMKNLKRKNSTPDESSGDESTQSEQNEELSQTELNDDCGEMWDFSNSNKAKTEIITGSGRTVKTGFFDNKYRVTLEDMHKLETLQDTLFKEGKSNREINAIIKVERRKCEKKIQRLKSKKCEHCNKVGHFSSNCPTVRPSITNKEDSLPKSCTICSKEGNPVFNCKLHALKDPTMFCLVCDSVGHLSNTCPQNPKSKYSSGRSCRLCGEVTHVVKRCPTIERNKKYVLSVLTPTQSIDALDYVVKKKVVVEKKKTYKIVKF